MACFDTAIGSGLNRIFIYGLNIGIWSILAFNLIVHFSRKYKTNSFINTACSTGLHWIFSQEGTCTIILTLTALEGNFGDVHPKKMASNIYCTTLFIKRIVCSTSDDPSGVKA